MSSKFIKPNINKINLVTTVSGQKHDKALCRFINKKWYLKGINEVENSGDVYQIKNLSTNTKKWYRNETGFIIFDHSKGRYMLKSDLQIIVENGIIGFDKEDNPIFGSFSRKINSSPLVELYFNDKIFFCLNEEIVLNCKRFKEVIGNGIYYDRNSIPSILFTEPMSCNQEYKNSLSYDCKGSIKSAIKKHEEQFQSDYNPNVKNFYKYLEDLSFGLEFETIKGVIPTKKSESLGLIPLRDGSIKGLEYVTIPLQGKIGLQTLINSIKELKKRTRYDNNCALHIHIGNLPRTEEFFIALYKVLFRLQDQIYELFPMHKRKNFGVKKKSYTKELPLSVMLNLDKIIKPNAVKKNFKHIFNFLGMGFNYKNYNEDLNQITNHPSDPNGSQKWNIKTRYHWVNLIPLLFGNKQTVEFRIHTPTYDENKIINYLFICTSIMNFTKNNIKLILESEDLISSLNLQDVLISSLGKEGTGALLSEITRYIDYRKGYIFKKTSSGDLVANEDNFHYKCRYIDWSKIKNNQTDSPNPYKIKKLPNSIEPGWHQTILTATGHLTGTTTGHVMGTDAQTVQHNLQNAPDNPVIPNFD